MISSNNSKAKLRCKVDAKQHIPMVDAVLPSYLMKATESSKQVITMAEQRAVEYRNTAIGIISN